MEDVKEEKKRNVLFHSEIEKVFTKREMIKFESTITIGKALETLLKNNIYGAPVKNNKTGYYIGFIDLIDIVIWISTRFKETEVLGEEFNLFNIETTEQAILDSNASGIVDISKKNPMFGVSMKAPMIIAMKVFATTSVHRIFVTKSAGSGKVMNVLTQSAIVDWLSKNLSSLGEEFTKKKIEELDLGQQSKKGESLYTIKETDTALSAFELMAQHKISAVSVVKSTDGSYIDCITAKDLRAILGKQAHLQPLYQQAQQFLNNKHLTSSSSSNNNNSNSNNNHKPVFRTTCSTSSTLEDVILILASQKYHRVFVLDDNNIPVGVITLGDVLKLITKNVKVHVMALDSDGKSKDHNNNNSNNKKPRKPITGDEDVDQYVLSMNDVEEEDKPKEEKSSDNNSNSNKSKEKKKKKDGCLLC